MPELPEVETVTRGLRHAMEGRRIVGVNLRRADLRFPFPKDFAARLTGAKISGLRRRAKYIVADLDSGEQLLMHLGMSGRFTVVKPDGKAHLLGEFSEPTVAGIGEGKHDHAIFSLSDGACIVYSDHRRFGMMDLYPLAEAEHHKLLKEIGPEPFGNSFNGEYLAGVFAGKKAPLKAALLDQTVVAGLGNIYVCEALFRSRLSPQRQAGSVAKALPRLDELVRNIRAILDEAILAGGSTLRDYLRTDGSSGDFQRTFSVYDREGEPCTNCGRKIKRIVQAGRSTFYCSRCQK